MTCEHCGGRGYFAECFDDLCHGREECIHGDDATCRVCHGEGEVPPYDDDFSDDEPCDGDTCPICNPQERGER